MTLVRAWKVGTSCFLNRIQKAWSMKEKMDELNPFLRSLNLHVGFSGGSHCFVLRPLILTHTWSGVSDGVWITVQLPHSYPKPSLHPDFCVPLIRQVWFQLQQPCPLRARVCAIELSFFSLPPLPFHFAPVLFILPSTASFFSVGLWVCFTPLVFLKVYFYKQKYSMLIITFISIRFS